MSDEIRKRHPIEDVPADERLLIAEARDDGTIAFKIPPDPLVAMHLLEQLTAAVKMIEINRAWSLRTEMQRMAGNGIQKPDHRALERFGRHRRS